MHTEYKKFNEAKELDSYKNNIELTNITPSLTNDQLKDFCDKAINMGYKSICVLPNFVNTVKAYLHGSDVKISTIIGLPDGKLQQRMKIDMIRTAVNDGVYKVNVVMESDIFKSEDDIETTIKTLQELSHISHQNGLYFFIIPEISELNYDDLERLVEICKKSNVNGIMTNTGMKSKGVELTKLQFIHRILPDYIKLQASGGIKNMDAYLNFYKYCDIISTSAFF